uniref:Aspartic protease inhibitor 10 n=1 Tax=Solanum tuberosum TaxID=4113 RepID=API10_SOLTU|nr:RecName: Full=Aspartic protease inhibitor 10; AltName: Full=Wound-induced aspartate proteinase CDI inhibitor; Flags: Precursor [Solanum tuberosum]CAA48036.1 cathepsin D inhibitor [Solanum tuberosum]
MMKCLFLLCLCLVPIVVFSSTFTSQNLIDLPSESPLPKPVLDTNGKELNPNSSYRIISIGRGALGGDVYLGKSPNSDAPCPDGVFRYNSDVGPSGTPVRFIPLSGGIFEDQLLNIQFNIPTVRLCVSYTIWKVGINAYLRTMLLETGGTIGQADSSYFKIVKSSILGYNLLYCPITRPILCPFCRDDDFCAKVGVVIQKGKRRLALVNENPLDVNFKEV